MENIDLRRDYNTSTALNVYYINIYIGPITQEKINSV